MTTEQKKFIEEIGRCELCGSKRNLQLHHMIPMVCQPDDDDNLLKKPIDLDIEDNWICVCCSCHDKLTPKNLLCKYGMNKQKQRNKKLLLKNDIYMKYCEYILACGDGRIDIDDWFAAFKYAISEI